MSLSRCFVDLLSRFVFGAEKRTRTGSEKNLLTFNGVLPMNFHY